MLGRTDKSRLTNGPRKGRVTGGSSPWWWNKYIDPPDPIPKEVKEQPIYKKGNQTVKFEGVHIPPPSTNTSDTYIFGQIDLDTGKRTISKNSDSDLDISINVNRLLLSMSLREGVEIGTTETTFLNCESLLKTNGGKKFVINNKSAPTKYYCTETTDGRVSQFKITSIKKYKIPGNNMYTIYLDLKYTTWKI